MEKYGTYRIFKNPETGETKRVPVTGEEIQEKTAELISENWVEVDKEEEGNELYRS